MLPCEDVEPAVQWKDFSLGLSHDTVLILLNIPQFAEP